MFMTGGDGGWCDSTCCWLVNGCVVLFCCVGVSVWRYGCYLALCLLPNPLVQLCVC